MDLRQDICVGQLRRFMMLQVCSPSDSTESWTGIPPNQEAKEDEGLTQEI